MDWYLILSLVQHQLVDWQLPTLTNTTEVSKFLTYCKIKVFDFLKGLRNEAFFLYKYIMNTKYSFVQLRKESEVRNLKTSILSG